MSRRLSQPGRETNPVAGSMRAAGYEYVHVDSGWFGSDCGPEVDQCVSAPFVDATVWLWLAKTPLIYVGREVIPHAFAYDGIHAMRQLTTQAERAQSAAAPRFVFAHILLPHPPMVVDRECEPYFDATQAGMTVASSVEFLPARRAAFTEQVRCVNKLIDEVSDAAPADAVVLMIADHGTASNGQLLKPFERWTMEDLWERFSVFAAIRAPERCARTFEGLSSSVNVVRAAVGCSLSSSVPSLPDRHFLVPATPEDTGPTYEVELHA